MPIRYFCNLTGECEPDHVDIDIGYPTQEACQEKCQASTEKELDYLMFGYALETGDDESDEVPHLAPADRVELIRRSTGVIVDPADSRDILNLIFKGTSTNTRRTVESLLKYPALWNELDAFAEEQPLQQMLERGTPDVLRWFLGLDNDPPVVRYDLHAGDWHTYLVASSWDDETREILFTDARQGPPVLSFEIDGEETGSVYALKVLADNNETAREWLAALVAETEEDEETEEEE